MSWREDSAATDFRLLGLKNPVGLIKDEDGTWTGEFASSDINKPPIKITHIHIHPSSHRFDPDENYVGLIVYLKGGRREFTINDVYCQTGDVFIKRSDWILKHTPTRKGRGVYVHGRLFYSIFGGWRTKNMEFVGAGFSYQDGQWKFVSNTLNTMNPNNNDDDYHDTYRGLSELEEEILEKTIEKRYINHQWLQTPPGPRISLKELLNEKSVNSGLDRKYEGTVSWVNYRQGYAFIDCDDLDEDVFVHCSEIADRPRTGPFLLKNDDVEFNVTRGRKGLEATNVIVIEDE